ncbi:response regulator [Asticcacaulis biprosthecium C19]|uniref:Response regulator n=1 Tax=Asticcacaulis biprosthecium C19 TaxID=715226 RepID=F4QHI3_9CAUL|nr:response regulator [Asticcacaulis biprosthecium]EGF92720.1 response regulator [Asticcacaulis biprosthecium C19]
MEAEGQAWLEAARLLVVDDDPILREFAHAQLSSHRVTVELASHGGEGLERLRLGGFDLALVDLDMPVMNGFELIRQVRADEALCDLPIVVVTSRDDMKAIDRAYAVGATAFAPKPLNWRMLSYQLAYILRNAREEDRIRAKAKALRQLVRTQDEVISLYEDGMTRLLQTLLDQAAQPGVARLAAELDRLNQSIRDQAGKLRA